jgi:hypothetical protein
MIEAILRRIQQAFLEREIEAKRSGSAETARVWVEASEIIQVEKRRVFGSPAENADARS